MKMTFNIPQIKKYTPPVSKIQLHSNNLAVMNTNSTSTSIVNGNIFQTLLKTGPCSSCGNSK